MTQTETHPVYMQDTLLIQEIDQPAVDEELFYEFSDITSGLKEFYAYLTIPKDRANSIREAWRRGESPYFLPEDQIDEDEMLTIIQRLKDFKYRIDGLCDDPDVCQLYRWKVNEFIAQIQMLLCSKRGDMSGFRRWSVFIYGEPDEDIYRAGLDWIAAQAEDVLINKPKGELSDAAQEVVEMLDGDRGYRELLIPDSKLYTSIREDHLQKGGYYALLLSGVEIPEVVTEAEGDSIVRQIMSKNLESDYDIEGGSVSWGVAHTSKKVKKPSKYRYSRERFIGLPLGHEVGTHLLESINGLRGKLKLASIGLDRFESGTEGRAVIREQIPYESFEDFTDTIRWRDIIRRQIAIGYGWGVGSEEPRGSATVHKFMSVIDRFYSLLDGLDEDVAQERTDKLLLRVLKGTDGKGLAYLKDKVYLEGEVNAWLEAELRGPYAISAGDRAKHNIANHRHTDKLQVLGVIS